MRLALIAALIGMTVANAQDGQKPKEPVETFSHKYFLALDKVNIALESYYSQGCTGKEFIEAAHTLSKKMAVFGDLYNHIPDDENDVTKAHEIETYIGLTLVVKDVAEQKEKCQASALTPKGEK